MLKRKHLILIFLVPLWVAADHITKTMALRVLGTGRLMTIIPDYLNLILVKNRGMVFGLFDDLGTAWRIPLFVGISVIAVVIIIHLFRQAKASSIFLPASLSLILSGAIGNQLDRIRWGYVVDFINLHYKGHHWPTFNLADTAITIGIVILIIETLFTPEEKPATEEDATAPEGESAAEGEPKESD